MLKLEDKTKEQLLENIVFPTLWTNMLIKTLMGSISVGHIIASTR